MSKLSLRGKGKKSYITIEVDPSPAEPANGMPVVLGDISFQPQGTLDNAIVESIYIDALNPARILVNSPFDIDVLNGHSLYISKTSVPTKVTIFDGSGSLTIEDISHSPIEVSMGCMGSILNVSHSGHNYSLKISPETIDISNYEANSLTITDVYQFVTICSTVNNLIKVDPFPLNQLRFLSAYQKLDHSLVEVFMSQNNLMPVCVIDQFIARHFFEFEAIAHSLEGSTLMDGLGSYDPIAEICSHLLLDDVKLQGDQPNNDGANIN